MNLFIKYFLLIAILLVCLCFAKNRTTTITINQEETIESQNLSLQKQHFPFCFQLKFDTVPLDSYVDTTLILQFIEKKNPVNIFSINYSQEYISEISKISDESYTYYRILISEDIVGLDYFLIIKEKPFECYISNKYNHQAERYDFIDSSLCFTDNSLTIYYPTIEITEKVYFNKFKYDCTP